MRNLEKANSINRSDRTLYESIMVPEVLLALKDWDKEYTKSDYVLIEGLAVSFWSRPRATTDIDLLFVDNSIPMNIDGFKKNRGHSFMHKITHVEIETITPSHISLPLQLTKKVFETSFQDHSDGSVTRIASREGLIALKAFRYSRQDQADIEALINSGANVKELLKEWPLSHLERERILDIAKDCV